MPDCEYSRFPPRLPPRWVLLPSGYRRCRRWFPPRPCHPIRPISTTAAPCSTPAAVRPAMPCPTRTPTKSIAPGSAAAWRSLRRSAPFTCRISRLTPKMDRPLERSEFRHRAVEGHIASRRQSLSGLSLHLLPAYPLNDVRDLFAYLKTLPPVPGRVRRHDLKFPFNQRQLLGGWKLLSLHGGPFVPDPSRSAQWNRGAYLVNGPGHCAECHSPRNMLGAIVEDERFAGGPTPDGDGWVPNITPAGLQHGDETWSEKDIASFLGDGMMPSGDFAGSTMAEVIRNTSLLGARIAPRLPITFSHYRQCKARRRRRRSEIETRFAGGWGEPPFADARCAAFPLRTL